MSRTPKLRPHPTRHPGRPRTDRTHRPASRRSDTRHTWKRCRLAGVGLLGLGTCLLLWAAGAQLARALPLTELLIRPRTLPGLLVALTGLSLVTIARHRIRHDLAIASHRTVG